MVITLIGYRGTGKSTLAAPLAERLDWEWLDADIELDSPRGAFDPKYLRDRRRARVSPTRTGVTFGVAET